ncbi:MAG: hypothetical protein ACLP9C_03705 [Acidimicrobiales bacterium]
MPGVLVHGVPETAEVPNPAAGRTHPDPRAVELFGVPDDDAVALVVGVVESFWARP